MKVDISLPGKAILKHMSLKMYTDPTRFWQDVSPFLLQHEAEYNLLISLLERLMRIPDFYKDYYLLAFKGDDGEVNGAAWLTPPHPLGLTELAEDQIENLLASVQSFSSKIPGVMGPVGSAERFKERWLKANGTQVKSCMSQGLYELREVIPAKPVGGLMRAVKKAEQCLLEQWAYNFCVDCKLVINPVYLKSSIEHGLKEKKYYFWKANGRIMAMAATSGYTPDGTRIGWVYTPPEERSKGYASALVAKLSQS